MATLTTNSLHLDEIWSYLKDGNRRGQLTVPVHLVKIHHIGMKETKDTQNDGSDSTTNQTVQSSQKSPRPKRKPASSAHTIWYLYTFKTITDALNSGRSVHVTADMNGCVTIQGTVLKRHSFGDVIDIFIIGSLHGYHHDYVRFSRRKVVTSSVGLEEVTREVSVYKNGSVVVSIIHSDPDTAQIRTVYSSLCTLYHPDSSNGDIKVYMNPFQGMKSVHTFGALRSSLKKGNAVRMIINILACTGATPSNVILGGDINNYDALDHSKTLEMTLSRPSLLFMAQDGISLQTDNYIFAFSADDRILVTIYSSVVGGKIRDHSIISGYRRYRCMMGNNANMKAVHFYKDLRGQ